MLDSVIEAVPNHTIRLWFDCYGNIVIFPKRNEITATAWEEKKNNNNNTQTLTKTLQNRTQCSRCLTPHVVVVPSAGCPTALPLWVPALSAGCLRGGGMVSGRYDAEEWLTPACHFTSSCPVSDRGMFTRVDAHTHRTVSPDIQVFHSVNATEAHRHIIHLLHLDAKHLRELSCHSPTKSLVSF